jgi:transcriptional regulator with XRE-family HTH domain
MLRTSPYFSSRSYYFRLMQKRPTKNPLAVKLGDSIRHLRQLKQLSQENMATMLGLTEKAYGDIEQGNSDYALSRLAEVAGVLGVTPEHIVTFPDRVAYFFDQCSNTNVNAGSTSVAGGQLNTNHYAPADLTHELEKERLQNDLLKTQNKLLQAEKQLAEILLDKEKAERQRLEEELRKLRGG